LSVVISLPADGYVICLYCLPDSRRKRRDVGDDGDNDDEGDDGDDGDNGNDGGIISLKPTIFLFISCFLFSFFFLSFMSCH